MVNFPTQIPDCDSHYLALLDFFLLALVFILQLLCLHWEILIMFFVVSVSTDFPSNSKRDAPFHRIACDYSCADWIGLHDHLRDVLWEDIFKLSASAVASDFCEWVQARIDVYISHCIYQVKLHSSPLLSVICVAAIIHRNHFFRLQQQNKSKSKVKFGQVSNRCKRVLKLSNLHILIK